MNNINRRVVGYGVLAGVLYWWTILLLSPGLGGSPPWIFLDYLNLLVHEAGHWLFLPFGETMSILGGSLLQCLLPAVFAGYFVYKKEWAGLAFGVWWVGNNLVNVSYYIQDASLRALPLLGGDSVGHDWYNLLSRWNMLERDHVIAGVVYGAGWLLLVGSLLGLTVVIFALLTGKKLSVVENS